MLSEDTIYEDDNIETRICLVITDDGAKQNEIHRHDKVTGQVEIIVVES